MLQDLAAETFFLFTLLFILLYGSYMDGWTDYMEQGAQFNYLVVTILCMELNLIPCFHYVTT